MLEIYVDADGCPVKDEAYRVAGRYGLTVWVVANAWLRVPDDPRVRRVTVTEGLDRADRGAGIERDAGPLAERPDRLQAAMQVRARLGVDGDQVGAGARERLEVRLVGLDHQVHVERLGRERPERPHHLRAEAQIGHEVAVHDIEMDPVGAGGVDRAHLLAQPREVGGQHGRGDQRAFGHDGMLSSCPPSIAGSPGGTNTNPAPTVAISSGPGSPRAAIAGRPPAIAST